jgi:hypothetical protein
MTDLSNEIAKALYEMMSDLGSTTGFEWQHSPKEFLPVQALCDYDGMMEFRNKMAEIILKCLQNYVKK